MFLEVYDIVNEGSFSKIYKTNIVKNLDKSRLDTIKKTYRIYKINTDYIENYLDGKKQVVLKHGYIPLIELEFLRSINYNDTIKNLIAIHICEIKNGIHETDIGLVFEKAICDMNVIIERNNKIIDKNFLIKCEMFFNEILFYFKKKNIVYGDWKFENILIYSEIDDILNLNFNNITIKLTDFGSIMKCGEKTENKKNVNIYYGSPFLSHIYDYIQPKFCDDYKSVCYLFYELNLKKLPWKCISSKFISNENFEEKILLITSMKYDLINYDLDLKNLTYWPESKNELDTFSYLFTNKSFKK